MEKNPNQKQQKAPATRAVKPQLVGKTPTKLEDIGPYVRAKYTDAAKSAIAAQEGMLDVGVALNKARTILKSNKAYGEWFDNQRFAFTVRWGNELARAGAVKAKVARALKAQIAAGGPPNFKKAVKVAEGKALPAPVRNQVPDAAPDDPDLVDEHNDDPAVLDQLPTKPLPTKGKPAKAAPVPVVAPGPDRPLTDEWVTAVIFKLEENLIPWVEKGMAEGVDEPTANALDTLAGLFFEASKVCGEASATALPNDED